MKTPDQISSITAIEPLAKTLADARQLVVDRVTSLHDELEATKNRRLPGLKSAVAAAIEAESNVHAAITASPELFVEPRTIIMHGMRIGYAKGRGKIVWDAWQVHGPGTTAQLAERSKISILSLRPRTTELFDLGFLCLTDAQPVKGEGCYRVRTPDEYLQWAERQIATAQNPQRELNLR